MKILNLKLVMLLEYENIKPFLQKAMFQVGLFYEKELQNTNQKEFRVEQVFKKGDKLYVKWKDYDNSFNSWIEKKAKYKWVTIFQNQNLQEEEWNLN